jgi:ubiquinone biosynthesis protein COQ9
MLKTDDTRDKLLVAALGHVAFDGWGEKALLTAAEETGIGADAARRAFPRGVASLIEYHSAWADRRMAEGLAQEALDGLGVRRRVAAAVRIRLRQNEAYREAIRAAVAHLALPHNGLLSLKCLYRTVDTVWFAVGDKSTDFNFYSKRALLASAYGATLLYWLDDQSEGREQSWAFLDRRLEDVVRIGRIRGNIERILPSPGLLARLFRDGSGRNFAFFRDGRAG